MDDFVGLYENAFSAELCSKLVDNFERLNKIGLVQNRQQAEQANKLNKDTSCTFSSWDIGEEATKLDSVGSELYRAANDAVWACINTYLNKYATLQPPNSGPMSVYTQKLQRTDVTGGYHVWHYESCNRASTNRVLLYIVYLNDVEEGGETELLYYARRIKPKAGTLLIIPAGFTHTHRGNPPLSGTKYILNGWVEL